MKERDESDVREEKKLKKERLRGREKMYSKKNIMEI